MFVFCLLCICVLLITFLYHVEGFHIWGTPMQDWYNQDELKEAISSPERSEYMCPFEVKSNSLAYDGLTWEMAHYLQPMPIYQMMLTSPDGSSVADSPIYRNPYWPTEANLPAEK